MRYMNDLFCSTNKYKIILLEISQNKNPYKLLNLVCGNTDNLKNNNLILIKILSSAFNIKCIRLVLLASSIIYFYPAKIMFYVLLCMYCWVKGGQIAFLEND